MSKAKDQTPWIHNNSGDSTVEFGSNLSDPRAKGFEDITSAWLKVSDMSGLGGTTYQKT